MRSFLIRKKYLHIIFLGSLYVLFVISATFSIVERFIYTNELFAITGLLLFVTEAKSIFQMLRKDRENSFWVLHCVIALIFIGFLQILISLIFFNQAPNIYVYFRTCVIWYSLFSFFLGIVFFNNFGEKILSKSNSLVAIVHTIACSLSIDRYNFSLMPLLFNKTNRFFFLAALLIVVIIKREDTPKLIFLIALFFYGFNKNRQFFPRLFNYKIIVIFIILFLISLYFIFQNYSPFFELDVAFAYQYLGVETSPGLANIIWRVMFWAYEFNTVTLASLKGFFLGFGFGTPVFNLQSAPPFLLIGAEKEYEEYFLGVHNSFLYLLFKQGIIVFILFLSIYFSIFKQLKKISIKKQVIPRTVFYYFISFLFITIAALFNVVLESSLFASIFWITTGMFYASIRKEILIKREY